MQDSDNNKPMTNGSQEPSPELLTKPQPPRMTVQAVKDTHEMLMGFRDGVKEGTYQGKHLKFIAMGLEFLDNMVSQSQQQLEAVKREEKEMRKRALEAIAEAGGKLQAEHKPIGDQSGNTQEKPN